MKKLLNEWDSFLKEAHCNTGHGNRDEDQNDDGANNFEDVRIARMKASGMSEKEIREKHPELFEEDVKHPPQYDAPEGSKRDKKLDKARELYQAGNIEAAAKLRQNMEKKERTKKEYRIRMSKEQLIETIHNTLHEELSKKTEKTLRKKAEDRGLTFGSVKKEYKKGLAAWVSSGSRKGMGQHQWAMARVNSANPSKSWAVVKKSKAKKK